MNALKELNTALEREIYSVRDDVLNKRAERGYVRAGAYLLRSLADGISSCLKGTSYSGVEITLTLIDRERLGADATLRLPFVLKERGATEYSRSVVPELITRLAPLAESRAEIESISAVGIHINILFSDAAYIAALCCVEETLGKDGTNRYGDSGRYEGRTAVCEYSSPNVAKHLHAGHIRSTIVGESLSRIYEASGYAVQRVNHINDWGGFGFLLEGWDRWHAIIPKSENKNDELYEVYLRYRALEKTGGDEWIEFKEASDVRFRALESGDPETVRRWSEMVEWSRAEFNDFYSRFGITFNHTIGESFYAERGAALVERGLRDGVIELRDGAAVAPLTESESLVVRRSDGATIYATRDLAALAFRIGAFDPRKIVYVVGEEQTAYFRNLFAAAEKLSIVASGERELVHATIGLYVDREKGGKISSRGGARGVFDLLSAARAHFVRKYESREYGGVDMLSKEDIARNADMLARGSIIFNDLRKDRTIPVEIDADFGAMFEQFEESGGAYIMYALARARGILRKYGAPVPATHSLVDVSFESIERALLKRIMEFPECVARAERTDNPGVIGNFVFELARDYQSYYAEYPVLAGGILRHPSRLVITDAVRVVLENALKLLGIESPEVL